MKSTDMTVQEAYGWAVKKWEYIVNNDGNTEGLFHSIPELDSFETGCAYCELFVNRLTNCQGCPLSQNGLTCIGNGHPYDDWDANPTKENAQKVLDLIIKTKP